MSTMSPPTLTTVPRRLTVPTCVGCGAMLRPGTCEDGCREQRLELVRAAAYDELVAVRQSAHDCADAFRAVVEQFIARQPIAAQVELSYRSVQDQARAILHRFPDPALQEQVLRGPTEPATTSWCADCDGIDAPQQCLEFCIWRPVDWVSYTSYQHERMRMVSEWLIESRLRQLLRRIASITPLEGEWARTWRALETEARTTLEAVNPAASKVPHGDTAEWLEKGGGRPLQADATGETDGRAAARNVTANDEETEEYEHGCEEGKTWAREFAPSGVLRDLIEKCELADSDFKTPHWRGFVSGAEQVLDISGPRDNGHQGASLPEGVRVSA